MLSPDKRTRFEALGKQVVIQAIADFGPSGELLRVRAETVAAATDTDLEMFAAIPRPLSAPAPATRSSDNEGFGAIFGRWPGDESEERLLAQLREFS